MEKLPSLKQLFEKAKTQAGDKKVKIADMLKMIDAFSITEYEFNEFFKEFIRNRVEELTQEDFDRQLSKIEKSLIEMCLGKGEEVKEQSEYVASNALNGENANQDDLSYPCCGKYIFSKIPKEGEEADLTAEDYNMDDYMTTINDMLGQALEKGNYLDMPLADLGKLLKDLSSYFNVVKKKAETLKEEIKDIKNKLENKEYQETFLQNKYVPRRIPAR